MNNIDVNGDSIWYTRNGDIVTMHVTAKIIRIREIQADFGGIK